jgi:hypothetical protein
MEEVDVKRAGPSLSLEPRRRRISTQGLVPLLAPSKTMSRSNLLKSQQSAHSVKVRSSIFGALSESWASSTISFASTLIGRAIGSFTICFPVINMKYGSQRSRYITLETMAQMSDDPLTGMPTVAAQQECAVDQKL